MVRCFAQSQGIISDSRNSSNCRGINICRRRCCITSYGYRRCPYRSITASILADCPIQTGFAWLKYSKEHPSRFGGEVINRRYWLIVGIIFLLGLFLRGVYLQEIMHQPGFQHPYVDESFHQYWAKALVTGDWSDLPQDARNEVSHYWRSGESIVAIRARGRARARARGRERKVNDLISLQRPVFYANVRRIP